MTSNEVQIRRDICGDCRRECAVRAAINHADPCEECPYLVWHRHSACDPSAPRPPASDSPAPGSPPLGLGDVVHAVAGPIGKAVHWPCVDQATGNLKPGSPCARARTWLNKKVPLTSTPPSSTK
jgi:hypothetical protein